MSAWEGSEFQRASEARVGAESGAERPRSGTPLGGEPLATILDRLRSRADVLRVEVEALKSKQAELQGIERMLNAVTDPGLVKR